MWPFKRVDAQKDASETRVVVREDDKKDNVPTQNIRNDMPLAVMDGCRKNLKYKNRLQRELKPGDCRILLCIALWAFTESRSTTGICKTFAVEHHLPLLESKCGHAVVASYPMPMVL